MHVHARQVVQSRRAHDERRRVVPDRTPRHETVRQRAREMQHEFPSLGQLLAKISEGIPVEGMESLAPALVDRLVPLTHYLPARAAIAVLTALRLLPRRLAALAIEPLSADSTKSCI